MAEATSDEARGRRTRLLIIVAVVLTVGVASLSWSRWIDNALDADVRQATLEIEQFFGDDASASHSAATSALSMGPTSERLDDWAQLHAARSLGPAETVQANLGSHSDIVLVYLFTRFGSDRCLTVTIEQAGKYFSEETSC